MIRTLDPHVPNVVRYQTALHSVTSGASIDQRFCEYKQARDKITTESRIFFTKAVEKPAFPEIWQQVTRIAECARRSHFARRDVGADKWAASKPAQTAGMGRRRSGGPLQFVARTHQAEILQCVGLRNNFPSGVFSLKAGWIARPAARRRTRPADAHSMCKGQRQ